MEVAVFDIETGGADELHSADYRYFRIGAWAFADLATGETGPTTITDDPYELISVLNAAHGNSGHNVINFDHMALTRWHGADNPGPGGVYADYEALCAKSFDTQLVEYHLNPIAAQGAQPTGHYKLGACSQRYGGPPKVDEIQRLARKYGGYHLIPLDDPDYRFYLEGDITASAHLLHAQWKILKDLTPEDRAYVRREHMVSTIMGRVTLEGVRVDVDLTMRRHAAGQARLDAGKQLLHEKYGMPLDGKKPHTTNLGKAAFRAAILGTGIGEDALDRNWPKNKDGSLSTGKDVLNAQVAVFDRAGRTDAADLCRTILALNGERSVYGTALQYLVGDRVHPEIVPEQSSGRWSLRKPGLTVMGKRGGKARERAIYIADSDDDVLVAFDLDQVDQRVIAAECQDPDYMAIFQDPGRDLHSEIAYMVFKQESCREEMNRNNGRCDCVYRDRAKACGHGAAYSMQANTMSIQTGLPRDECQEFLTGMMTAFPVKTRWTEEIRRQAGTMPYGVKAPEDDKYRVLRTWKGRPVRVERDRGFTQSVGQIGQGGTRDVMAECLLRLPQYLRRRIRAVIHDEILFSLPKQDLDVHTKCVLDAMTFDLMGVPITSGSSRAARSWAGCYGEQYEDQ